MKRSLGTWAGIGTFCFALLAGIATFLVENHQTQAMASQFRSAMNLVNLPASSAPDFTLTDESGHPFRLSALKGKVVILTFLDPKCTDVCPIISAEFIAAAKDLGADDSKVEYVGVNVNTYHRSSADLLEFSRDHGLARQPNWHFVNGSPSELARVWKSYGVYVKQNPTGDVVHSDYIYFIDQHGDERYIAASATSSKTSIKTWGEGISFYVKKLL